MKYLIYLRVSKEGQQDVRSQEQYCLSYLKERNRNFEHAVYTDKMTARKSVFTRPGSKQMLADMKKGDCIVAVRLDRLSRVQSDSTRLIQMVVKQGIDIILVDQPQTQNKILLGIYSGMAEEEIIMLRKRVQENFQAKRKRNERISGQLPYGYTLHETKMVAVKMGDTYVLKKGILIPLPEEQEVLSHMLEFFERGMSYQNIADTLTNLGYTSRAGKPFLKSSIHRILSRIKKTKSLGQPRAEKEPHPHC